MTFNLKRRTLLASGIAIAAGAYGYHRGMRYPVLSLEAPELAKQLSIPKGEILLEDCFELYQDKSKGDSSESNIELRAFAPEPSLTLRSAVDQTLEFKLNNVSPEAVLDANLNKAQELSDGINRQIKIDLKADQEITLKWRVPFIDDYTFASIGDTGGNHELDWCIQRAHELGAKFLLHLGDFNYQEGDYARSIKLFHNAPLPCYITIGNHDFHDSGLQHNDFTDYLGPFNNVFQIGDVRFLNIDTAATVWPYASGKRGGLIKKLVSEGGEQPNTIAYTHCPLHDPTPNSTHDIGNNSERDWIVDSLKKLNAKTLLSGHIHIFDRSEFMGIDNIIVGQGMGHQDLLTADTSTSKMAVGQVSAGGKVEFSFAPLNMPFMLHCHPRVEPVKASIRDSSDKAELIKQIDAACSEQTST